MKTKSPPPKLAELAAGLKVSVRRVSTLKSQGMPVDSLASAVAWRLAKSGTGASDSAEELRQRRIALLKQQERRAKIDADERAKLLIPISLHHEVSIRCAIAAKSALWNLLGTMPPELSGLTEIPIFKILEARFRDVLQQLSDKNPEFWFSEKGQRVLDLIEKEFPSPKS